MASIPNKFEICIRRENELTGKKVKKDVCYKIFQQRVRLVDQSRVYHYIFVVLFI